MESPMKTLVLAVLLLLRVQLVRGVYILNRDYSGSSFFDGWDFYGFVDNTTWGNVTYVDQPTATSQKLAYIEPSNGHAIIRVDNTTNIPRATLVNRPSVRITTKDAFTQGSLFIMDTSHIPYGCSVWPSFWTLGVGLEWPDAGEIDIIEGVNGLPFNQMAIHTTPGCFQAENSGQTGRSIVTNCTRDEGCLVQETKPHSYGAEFAQAGGGVFATQFDVSGVYIWYWSRPNLPQSILNAKVDQGLEIADWGAPSASYPASACDIRRYFQPQKLIINISLCGLWAGIPSIYSQTCSGQCIDQVFGNGNNYGTAYWDVSYVRVYTAIDNTTKPTTLASATTPGPSTANTSTPTLGPTGITNTNQPNSNSSAALIIAEAGSWLLLVALVAIPMLFIPL